MPALWGNISKIKKGKIIFISIDSERKWKRIHFHDLREKRCIFCGDKIDQKKEAINRLIKSTKCHEKCRLGTAIKMSRDLLLVA